jgi:hypothetical protein
LKRIAPTSEGTFDFVEESTQQPGKEQRAPQVLNVANALPVHELRQALARREFKKNADCPWPTAPLIKSRGWAQLKPVEVDDAPVLPEQREIALEESMLAECQKLSDLDADVLDALSALYLTRARAPTDDVKASVNELLGMRGLRPRLSGQKRRGGYSVNQRGAIINSLTHLEDVWLTFANFRSNFQGPGNVLQTRCFTVNERIGQLCTDGTIDIREFVFRPGPTYGELLFGRWRQTALLAAKALQYDPVQAIWEKRIARYLSWQWRIRATGRLYFQPLRVRTLLEVVGEMPNRPHRIRARFESCLDRLKKDFVIAQWQYDGWPGLWGEQMSWKDEWNSANVLIEPPDFIRDGYIELGNRRSSVSPVGDDLGDRIRMKRQIKGLSLLCASEESMIPPTVLDLLECGRKRPSMEEFKLLQKWLVA